MITFTSHGQSIVRLRLGCAIAICGVVWGCAEPSLTSPSPSPPQPTVATVLRLPFAPASRFEEPCAGSEPGGGILAGEPADPRVVWIDERGRRLDLLWPPGFSARVGPPISILSPDGSVLARVGDPAPALCATQQDLVYFASLNR
jgi:hypothetical protein